MDDFLLTCSVDSRIIIWRSKAFDCIGVVRCGRQQTTETFYPLDSFGVHFQLAIPDEIFADLSTWQNWSVQFFNAFRNKNRAHYRIKIF